MATPIFNFEKTIHSVLYITERLKIKDFHKIFKIIYFADREHLAKYGRPITGDTYIRMADGPVPSKLFDIFKAVRGDSFFQANELKEYFTVNGRYLIKPEKKPDMRCLSKTDILELDKSISKYGELSFGTLREISHGIAWGNTKENGEIIVEDILREAGEEEDYITYISDFMNCQKALAEWI
jgi:uncharacterized phage-associated protein